MKHLVAFEIDIAFSIQQFFLSLFPFISFIFSIPQGKLQVRLANTFPLVPVPHIYVFAYLPP